MSEQNSATLPARLVDGLPPVLPVLVSPSGATARTWTRSLRRSPGA